MDSGKPKFLLPPPNFSKAQDESAKTKPLYLTPSGMTLLTREKQPPPMYGVRGATIPPKFMHEHGKQRKPQEQQYHHNHHHQHPQHQQQQTHQVLPSPQPEYCESCDMMLQSPEDMKRHRSQHEPCPADGCKFYGLASVMDKHVMRLHSTGLYDKLKKLSTPEEIKAWREERKKKYPTLANIELKQRAREQRQRRGERLEASRDRFGKQEDRKRAHQECRAGGNEEGSGQPNGRPNDRKRQRRRPNKDRKAGKSEDAVKATQGDGAKVMQNVNEVPRVVEKDDNICDGVQGFRGTSHLKSYKHFKTKSKNVLSNLLGMYGSDDDEDNGESDEEESEGDSESEQQTMENVTKEASQVETANETKPSTEGLSDEKLVVDEITDAVGSNSPTNPAETVREQAVGCSLNQEDPKDSSDEAPEEAAISHECLEPELPKPAAATPNIQGAVEKPQKTAKVANTRQMKRKLGLNYRLGRLRKQNTMLEKLLEPDIRHERNVLLQCVRFVCQNQFFGIGATDKQVQ